MTRRYGLLGVPSSAGAKTPGIEKAPAALRAAGLVERLQGAGGSVHDHGDLARVRYRPDKAFASAQNLVHVVAVAQDVAAHVGEIVDAGETPLVLGGDCSITVGVMAGFVARFPGSLLVYMDGGVDLETPATNPEGNLDSMGVTHMIGHEGVTDDLSRVGDRFPLLTPSQVVFYGYEPMPPGDAEEIVLGHYAMRRYPAEDVRGRAQVAAREALTTIEAAGQPFFLHFDVDVIDFVDFPIADVPQFNKGLTLTEAMASLSVFAASPRFGGLVITEVNPDHMDEEGEGARTFVQSLVGALQSSAAQAG